MTDPKPEDDLQWMSSMLHLQAKAYPYMFSGPRAELIMYVGWYAPFVELCDAIDETLGDDKHGFRWVQLKEKFGQPRWYWEMEDESGLVGDQHLDLRVGDLVDANGAINPSYRMSFRKEVPGELRARIRTLVDAATDACVQRCMDCGQPALGRVVRGWLQILCDEHASQRMQDNPNQDL